MPISLITLYYPAKYYYKNDKLHRPHELGPAAIESNGSIGYCENGNFHRPHEIGAFATAYIWSNGTVAYWENGYEIKNINQVVDKKNKTDFIKGIFKTTNDEQLKLFFQQETHNEVKEKFRIIQEES